MTEQNTPEKGPDGMERAPAPSPASMPQTNSPSTSPGAPTGGAGSNEIGAEAVRAVEGAEHAAKKVLDAVADVTTPEIPDLAQAAGAAGAESIGLLEDVQLQVRIELGRTRMVVEDVLRLSSGAVVELDKAAGDPVDIYVNGRRIARGEVLVLNENFCVRVSEIVDQQARTA